jgi:hypothetical protein
MIYMLFFGSARSGRNLIEGYPIIVLYSLVFSLPTLIVYFFIYRHLLSNKINPNYSKIILTTLTVIGITITFLFLGGQMEMGLISSYSVTTITAGFIYKFNVEQTEK